MRTHPKPSTLLALGMLLMFSTACFQEKKKPAAAAKASAATSIPEGELHKVATERGLTDDDLINAAMTFVPTGARDTAIGVMATGNSGRLAVFGLPSMRIIKYVGLFTPEPWQGFGYDDESKAILRDSGRQDIEYKSGDSGLPALSETGGKYDGRMLFAADAASARIAVMSLTDYETHQIVTNPVFHTSLGEVAVTPDSEYVVQTSSIPTIPGGKWADPASPGFALQLRGGLTFWHFAKAASASSDDEEIWRLAPKDSFSLELPPYVQGQTDLGKGASDGYVFTLGACRGGGVVPGGAACDTAQAGAVLHVVNWKQAATLLAKAATVNDHPVIALKDAVEAQVLRQIELPAGPQSFSVSPDGKVGVVTFRYGNTILLLDLAKLAAGTAPRGAADAFGVPTLPTAEVTLASIDVGGPAVDAAFAGADRLYVSITGPGRLVRVDLATRTKTTELLLGYDGGKLAVMGSNTVDPAGTYAVVMNAKPHGRYQSVGPVLALNANLYDISGDTIRSLYTMSVPQATQLAALIFNPVISKATVRYKVGTDSRSNLMSPYGTLAGQERIERNGKRVQVFGTLIRSHITPEIVEVDEGDIVTFHMTNLEQAQDQTHGFTVDTYGVHGSWEPGKTASVTLTADRPGVFPYYCTEFCSALHLEMEGYMMVKPKGWKGPAAGTKAAAGAGTAAEKADFDAKMKVITETQTVIDSVVTWLKAHDFAKDARAKAAVDDAFEQLGRTKDIQPKIDAAVAAQDWATAKLWAEQFFQYQVKCADAGLRAKKILTEGGAQ